MADFYPILSRAVAGLPDTSPEARRAVYERARAALVAQLRGLDPPLGEAEIMRERLSLDEAVAKVEADYGDAPAAQTGQAAPVIRPLPEPERMEPAYEPAPRAESSRDDGRFEDPLPEPAEPQVIRPRVAPPRERRVNPGHVRTAIVGTGVAIAVAAIAGAAYYVNKVNPPQAVRPHTEAPVQAPQADNAGKLSDRVGDAGAPANPATPARPAQDAQAPAQQGAEVAVAQRAILYTETPENPQQPRAVNGRVFWRLDSESAGQGRPVETIVRATIEIPDAGLGLDFTVRRNTDSAFPASHIIGLRFTSTGSQAVEAIREIGVPQFKTDENERGAPLSAINSALGDNLFVAALSNVPVELERNTDLIMNRNWIDIPVRFASGKRGIITFEKGISGNQTLADAFGRWR
jgi:hypothetical protein